MATAYAALVSVMNTIELIQKHPRPPIRFDQTQVDSLKSKIQFLQQFLEVHHSTIDHGLESRIADATYAAEDLIDSRVRDNQLPDQEDKLIYSTNDSFQSSLQRAIDDLEDLIKKEVKEVKDNYEQSQGNKLLPRQHHPVLLTSSSSSSTTTTKSPNPNTSGENVVVGVEEILDGIKKKLTLDRDSGSPQIISISGMGGIGKTTLALKVYNDSYIKNHFYIRAWATISKDYNTHESLVELVHCLNRTESKESLSQQSDDVLGLQIHKSLFGRRYLVVLDDVWEVDAWMKVKSYFPASKGNGIVITTRESSVASIGSHRFDMNLLDEDKSWDLFCQKVFGQDRCPLELEAVGKEISNNCRGLPLSIAVIGGHLLKSPRTQEYWQFIADNLSSIVNSELLSLRYAHLPIHLKPCLLYMGMYPEDEVIEVPKLIRLWVAEGFLKPIVGKSLEETAEEYLNDLIGRNLVLVVRLNDMGKLYNCKIHDLLRDLCVKEAMEKNFYSTVQKHWLGVSNNEQRIVVPPSASDVEYPVVMRSPALLRTLIFHGKLPSVENNELLRVLAPIINSTLGTLYISEDTIVEVTHQLVSLRYIEFSPPNEGSRNFVIPPSICLLWNLQFLIIKSTIEIKAPPEIWKMPHLREISVSNSISLPHPGPIEDDNSDILKSLHSLSKISNFSFCEEVVNRIPNIKKLKVVYDDEREGFDEGAYTLNNVTRLVKLESFSCLLDGTNITVARDMLRDLNLPYSLKELSISHLHWEDVTTKIGSLPLLEVLELWMCWGSEWELVEGQFSHLRILKLYLCGDLEYIIADENHLPCLQELFLNDMKDLKEISSDIGLIPTLTLIELRYCSDSAILCAKRIAEEAYEAGNEQLQVEVKGFGLPSRLGSSTPNFHFHQ